MENEEALAERARLRSMFVQQQISLIKRIQEVGLKPEDIFNGIGISLDASTNDLLGTTDKVSKIFKQLLEERYKTK